MVTGISLFDREERMMEMKELAPAVLLEILGGNCLVQGEGSIDGVSFYFRARGARWTLSVG